MRRGLSLGAFLALWALALPVLPSLVHADDAVHVICPEHGELVHGSAGAERLPSATDAASAGRPAPTHEHCELCWSLVREGLVPGGLEDSPASCAGFELWGPAPGPQARAVLEYAPKSSPPARASAQ